MIATPQNICIETTRYWPQMNVEAAYFLAGFFSFIVVVAVLVVLSIGIDHIKRRLQIANR